MSGVQHYSVSRDLPQKFSFQKGRSWEKYTHHHFFLFLENLIGSAAFCFVLTMEMTTSIVISTIYCLGPLLQGVVPDTGPAIVFDRVGIKI